MSVSYTSPRRQLVRCYFRFRVFGSLMMFVTISCCGETVTTILTKLSEQTRNSSCTMPWNSPGAAPCSGTRGEFCCAVLCLVHPCLARVMYYSLVNAVCGMPSAQCTATTAVVQWLRAVVTVCWSIADRYAKLGQLSTRLTHIVGLSIHFHWSCWAECLLQSLYIAWPDHDVIWKLLLFIIIITNVLTRVTLTRKRYRDSTVYKVKTTLSYL